MWDLQFQLTSIWHWFRLWLGMCMSFAKQLMMILPVYQWVLNYFESTPVRTRYGLSLMRFCMTCSGSIVVALYLTLCCYKLVHTVIRANSVRKNEPSPKCIIAQAAMILTQSLYVHSGVYWCLQQDVGHCLINVLRTFSNALIQYQNSS